MQLIITLFDTNFHDGETDVTTKNAFFKPFQIIDQEFIDVYNWSNL